MIDLHVGASSVEPYSSIPTNDQEIGVAVSGRYASEYHANGRWRRGVYDAGAICINRRDEAARRRFEPFERIESSTAMVYLPYGELAGATEHLRRVGQRSREPSLHFAADRDPAILHMTKALLRAMSLRLDDLYAQTAGAWLATHLVTRYGRAAGLSGDSDVGGAITDARIARVIDFMSLRYGDPLTLEELAAEACVSKYHFTRLFRQKVGQTPHRFLSEIRLEAAGRMLLTSDLSVAEVGRACGYPASASFSSAFAARYGVTPTAHRARRDRH